MTSTGSRPIKRVDAAFLPVEGALDLLVAGALAYLAGATDVYGVGLLRDLFVSFMSGNTTMLGLSLGEGDWARSLHILGLIALFIGGASVGAAVGPTGGRVHAAVVTSMVAALLSVPLVRRGWSVASMTVAMGALNAAMDHVGRASVSLTYVTGTLVKLGQGLGRAIRGAPAGWTWLWQLPMWLSLLGGVVSAVVVRSHLGTSPWLLPALAALIACLTWMAAALRPAGRGDEGQSRP